MNSEPRIELLKIRNISNIFVDTLAFAKANYKSLFSGLFYICSPILLFSAVFYFLFMKGYFNALFSSLIDPSFGSSSGPLEMNTLNEILLLIPYFLLLFLGIYLSMCFIVSVSFSFIKLYRQSSEISTGILWETSKKYIGKIMGAQLIFIFATLIAYALCFIPLFLLFTGATNEITSILLTVILFFTFIVVLFYFYVKLTFHQHFIIVEDKGIWESFKLSYHFSKGIFWKTFFSIFLLSLAASLCGSLFQMPGLIITYFGLIMGIISGENDQSFITLLGVALLSIGMMLSYILYSIIFIGTSFIYYSTIEERYGLKAEEQIVSIGKHED